MNKVLVIVGPTGVGKTKCSILLAKAFHGEIINADSMQIYQEMNIGTAKITEKEKEQIPHHLLDQRKIEEEYSVYDYQKEGRLILNQLLQEGKTPIVVGGTGLYIKALLFDYEFNKEEQKANYLSMTNEDLYQEILKHDSTTTIHPHNRRRLERAYQKILNNTYMDKKVGNHPLYELIVIGLTMDREELYRRIDQRVDQMIENGLLDEATQFYKRGIRSKAILTGIGYKEFYQYLDGFITYDEAVQLIKKNSRHYAKRQYTWFKHQMNVLWFTVSSDHFDQTIQQINDYIKEALI